ncbi:MAG: hypothetical protein KOO63_05585 [Bacteroidales bacterium]|nr:hypothetical protein [Candidatus Latescibacterota bacterium]
MAAGVITRGGFGKFLWPGMNSTYAAEYKKYPEEYTELFSYNSSDKAYEEDVGLTSLGLAPIKPENKGITYDSMSQGFVQRYAHIAYALGFIVSWEMWRDSQYRITNQMLRKPRALAYSLRQTKEHVAANVFNRGFNSAYTGADGLEMFSSVHPNQGGYGGTYRNELETPSDLSEKALEQADIDIAGWTNDRGLKIKVMPRKLAIPRQLKYEAERILKSPLRVGTANNDINALRNLGTFPEGYTINHYFTDADAWFIITDCPDGLKYFDRDPDKFEQDDDFDTKNAKFSGYFRCSFGWTDAKGVFGSEGG